MQTKNKVVRYDYSKYDKILKDGAIDADLIKEYEFWGFHMKKGRLHIDTKRYKKVCTFFRLDGGIPKSLFAERNTVYYVPSKKGRHDYNVNIFRDLIWNLKREWDEEYKPLFWHIKTPEDVYKMERTEAMMYTSSPDDLDDIEFDALMSSIRREDPYTHIVNSLYLMFLQKIVTEVDRFTLSVMVKCGYENKSFSFDDFLKFTSQKTGVDNANKVIAKYKGYNCFNLIHKINNFLKHNTRDAYESLLQRYPENVRNVKNGTANREYINGEFAGDWVILKKGYIDKVFNKLIDFFDDYCEEVFKEDINRASWDSDEYFFNSYRDDCINILNPF